jgi:hypothetical protein
MKSISKNLRILVPAQGDSSSKLQAEISGESSLPINPPEFITYRQTFKKNLTTILNSPPAPRHFQVKLKIQTSSYIDISKILLHKL